MLDTLKLKDHLEEGMGGFSLKNADTQFALLLLTNVHACTKMISQHFKRPDPLSLSLLVHRAPFFAVSLQWTAIFICLHFRWKWWTSGKSLQEVFKSIPLLKRISVNRVSYLINIPGSFSGWKCVNLNASQGRSISGMKDKKITSCWLQHCLLIYYWFEIY